MSKFNYPKNIIKCAQNIRCTHGQCVSNHNELTFNMNMVCTEMGKENSRTFPGLFQDFFLLIEDSGQKHQNEKVHSISTKFQYIGMKTVGVTDYINQTPPTHF